MFPQPFSYRAPETLVGALELLEHYGEEAKVLAGGQSLLPMMKLRLARPGLLVDIARVKDLMTGVKEDNHYLAVGALTPHAWFTENRLDRFPLLSETSPHIADPLVRNRGTMAGSLSHADPAADWGAALLALKAEVQLTSRQRQRTVRLEDFFVDTFFTVAESTEILTEVRIPIPSSGWVGARYLKLERKVGDFAVVGVAVHAVLNDEGRVITAGIGLAAVGPTPLAARDAENFLVGKSLTDDAIREAAHLATLAADPISDRRGSREYKAAMVRLFVKRGLTAIREDFIRRRTEESA